MIPSNNMATLTYTLNEVNKHKGRESCWIVIDGKVYDVTKYLDQHPGGDEEILNESGTDATVAFIEVGHSSDAKEILETLLIGSLHPDDIRAIARKNHSIPNWARLMWAAIVTRSKDSISNHWSFTCYRIAAVAAVPITVTVIFAFILLNRK